MIKTIYVDMDDTFLRYTEERERRLKAIPAQPFPQSQYGFYASLQPLEGAVEAVLALMESDEYDFYFLTAPSLMNLMSYTEKAVSIMNIFGQEMGLEMLDRMIINNHKHKNKGDILIDNCDSGRGQELFEGELIHFGTEKFPDWKAVRAYLGV